MKIERPGIIRFVEKYEECVASYKKIIGLVIGVLAITPNLCLAAPPGKQPSVLLEFDWQIGDVHTEQRRWGVSFAMGSAGDVHRSINKRASLQSGQKVEIGNEILAGYFQERSPYALKWSTDSFGNSLGLLYGLPVMEKFSPVLNATDNSDGSSTSVFANPWTWVGAIAIGLAVSSSDNGGSDEDTNSVQSSCAGGETVVPPSEDFEVNPEGCASP